MNTRGSGPNRPDAIPGIGSRSLAGHLDVANVGAWGFFINKPESLGCFVAAMVMAGNRCP